MPPGFGAEPSNMSAGGVRTAHAPIARRPEFHDCDRVARIGATLHENQAELDRVPEKRTISALCAMVARSTRTKRRTEQGLRDTVAFLRICRVTVTLSSTGARSSRDGRLPATPFSSRIGGWQGSHTPTGLFTPNASRSVVYVILSVVSL